jgi:hypothetical protein
MRVLVGRMVVTSGSCGRGGGGRGREDRRKDTSFIARVEPVQRCGHEGTKWRETHVRDQLQCSKLAAGKSIVEVKNLDVSTMGAVQRPPGPALSPGSRNEVEGPSLGVAAFCAVETPRADL